MGDVADIKLRVYTQGGEPIDIESPSDMHTEEFVNELAAALDLPARDAQGHAISWRLDNKDTGRTLDPARSLEANGVREGHRLSLIREVTAGVCVVAPDGRERSFDCGQDWPAVRPAPGWLLEAFGCEPGNHEWLMMRSGEHRFSLVRPTIAAAGRDPRQHRLQVECEQLLTLNSDSDYVQVRPTARAGSAPEKYEVVFKCRGIASIDNLRNPNYSDYHVVSITCHEEFPSKPPNLYWSTPIWHPNIGHDSKSVCINAAEWLGAMGIYDLCRQMFEMVQYKNYHAEDRPPYPLDRDVAAWVRDYAEPRGIVDKRRGIYVDDKPFVRPMAAAATGGSRLRIRPVRSAPAIRIIAR
jgi:ubiquitin-protein ligase